MISFLQLSLIICITLRNGKYCDWMNPKSFLVHRLRFFFFWCHATQNLNNVINIKLASPTLLLPILLSEYHLHRPPTFWLKKLIICITRAISSDVNYELCQNYISANQNTSKKVLSGTNGPRKNKKQLKYFFLCCVYVRFDANRLIK